MSGPTFPLTNDVRMEVHHHTSPVIGWLRLHIWQGTTPDDEEMQNMVDYLKRAIEASDIHKCEETK